MISTDRLQQLEELAEAVGQGSLSRSGFGEAVAEVARELAALGEEFQAVDLPDESAELLTPERSLGAEGLDLVRQGLERMAGFVESGNQQDLSEGLDLARCGLEQVAQVAELLRGTRELLERRIRGRAAAV